MSGVKQATLVTLYCTVCGNHSIIEEKTQHLLNHRFPKFSDEKCITAYLWGKKAADKRYNSSRKSYYDWQSLFAELVFFLSRKYLCSRKLPFLNPPTAGNAYGHPVFLRFWNFRLFSVSFCRFNHGFPDGWTENAQPMISLSVRRIRHNIHFKT